MPVFLLGLLKGRAAGSRGLGGGGFPGKGGSAHTTRAVPGAHVMAWPLTCTPGMPPPQLKLHSRVQAPGWPWAKPGPAPSCPDSSACVQPSCRREPWASTPSLRAESPEAHPPGLGQGQRWGGGDLILPSLAGRGLWWTASLRPARAGPCHWVPIVLGTCTPRAVGTTSLSVC